MSAPGPGGLDGALGAMRESLARLSAGPRDGASPQARLADPPRIGVPSRVANSGNALVELFAERARKVSATVEEVASSAEVPARVAAYLAAQGLGPRIFVSPDPLAAEIAWSKAQEIVVAAEPMPREGAVAIAGAVAAVAETGSLAVVSGSRRPIAYHMVPETEVMLVRRSSLVATQEEAWITLRKRSDEPLPRDVTFVTGPSRTADIEMRVELGAHGPRRLHVIVLGDR